MVTYDIKGGVGKTTTAVNLSYFAAETGTRTLVCDLDLKAAAICCFWVKPRIRGSGRALVGRKRPLTRHIRQTDHSRLDLLLADFSCRHLDLLLDHPKYARRLLKRLRRLDDDYAHLFFDCAPSISLVSEAVFEVSDALFVPTIPTTISGRTLRQLARRLRWQRGDRIHVLPFLAMVDRRRALRRRVCSEEEALPFPMPATRVPCASVVKQMGVRRVPVFTFSPDGPAVGAYRALWAEICGRVR